MGRKKKKASKPWCWYCGREFDDEKILIQHQKAKHFKCHICNKKLFTGPGLAIHCMQVHKETIDKIPGAIQGRDSIDVEVFGMEGIPQEYEGPSEPKAKKPSMSIPTTSAPMMPGFPMPGMPFPQMPAMSMPSMPAMPMPSIQPSYVPGQFFGGARNQFPTLPNAQMMKQAFPQGMPTMQGFPTMSMPGFPSGIPNAANIPLPSSIPTPSIGKMPTYSAYQTTVPAMPSGGDTYAAAASSYSLQSTSAQPSAQKSLGAKTRIVVPDENTSLEESMAHRLEMLSQVRYH